MRPKCGGKSGNGFIFKKINENENIKTKKILQAIQKLPAIQANPAQFG